MRIHDTGAVVLAGGRARRLGGRDKAFLLFHGRYLIEHVFATCEQLFEQIIVVTRTPEDYRRYPVFAVTDLVDEGGSLAGLYTGLQVSSHPRNFVVACDMPFICADFIAHMAREMQEDDDVLLPAMGSHGEPLHAFYTKRCVEPIRRSLREERYRLIDFHDEVRVRYIPEHEIRQFDPDLHMLANINYPSDMKKYGEGGERQTGDIR